MTERPAPYTAGQGVLLEEGADEALIRRHPVRRSKDKTSDPPASAEARAWMAAERRRRNLETMLAGAVKNQDRARQRLLEAWSMNGTNTEKVDGHTVHLKRKLYPKVRSKDALTETLKQEGLTDLLTADEKAFAAYVTEQDETGQALPDSIAALITDQFERFDVAARLT